MFTCKSKRNRFFFNKEETVSKYKRIFSMSLFYTYTFIELCNKNAKNIIIHGKFY